MGARIKLKSSEELGLLATEPSLQLLPSLVVFVLFFVLFWSDIQNSSLLSDKTSFLLRKAAEPKYPLCYALAEKTLLHDLALTSVMP